MSLARSSVKKVSTPALDMLTAPGQGPKLEGKAQRPMSGG
jgi:hypothetical protein